MFSRTFPVVALLAIALAGCGGGKSSTNTTTTTQMSATAVPTTEAQRETAALPQGTLAPVPASLNCGSAKPVWVNMHTKAYHEAADPYYGRTKNGQYMCAPAALAAGYHAAGSRHHKKKNGNTMDNAPAATATP